MEYSFSVTGHENLLATHKNTLEFTKEDFLTKNGDCILGINASFDSRKLKSLLKFNTNFELLIKVGDLVDSLDFVGNIDFVSDKELVIRRSNFVCERTFGINASKTAFEINREIVKKLQNPSVSAEIIIRPKIKLFIFDFDDTLEDFSLGFYATNNNLGEIISKEFSLEKKKVIEELQNIDHHFCSLGVGKTPDLYDRFLWFKELSKRLNISPSDEQINFWIEQYWQIIFKKVRLFTGANSLLKRLSPHYKLVMLTDSDGPDDSIKINRIKKLKIFDYFDFVMTGNLLNQNKPSKKLYDYIFEKFGVSASECVMVGDKPQVDLSLAKELGITTVQVNKGVWISRHKNEVFDYVDYKVDNVKKILDIRF